jgi:hypothetical protein
MDFLLIGDDVMDISVISSPLHPTARFNNQNTVVSSYAGGNNWIIVVLEAFSASSAQITAITEDEKLSNWQSIKHKIHFRSDFRFNFFLRES